MSLSQIEYRPLQLEDAQDLANILGEIWHTDVEGEARQLHGLIDLAIYAQQPTWAQVAEMDGRAVGVVMARAGEPSSDQAAPWQNIEEESWDRLAEMPDGKADELRTYFDGAQAIDAELLAESGCDPNYELVLFAVSGETQGRGVGSALLNAAQDYLREQGATHAFIYTDTDCNWQYYERRGMEHKAERAIPLGASSEADGANSAEAAEGNSVSDEPPFCMFVYEMKL